MDFTKKEKTILKQAVAELLGSSEKIQEIINRSGGLTREQKWRYKEENVLPYEQLLIKLKRL